MSGSEYGYPGTTFDNPLLKKPQLGQTLQRGYSLPDNDFTYGRPNVGKDNGASEALSGWIPSGPLAPIGGHTERKPERDFVALNKACVGAGLVTASDQFQYRATHDVRRRISEEEKSKSKVKRIPASMTFGISTRPSTPVFDLLEHKYQDRWLQERRKSELNKRERHQQKQHMNRGIYETRASLLRKFCPPVEDPPLWQMTRFSRQLPHLETFRSIDARDRAFQHHSSDCTARTGAFGHGIYESAKS